jgi:Fe-S cluster assembly protein SufD
MAPEAETALLPEAFERRLAAVEAGEPAWHRRRRREAALLYARLPVPERPRTPLKGRRLESIPYLDPPMPVDPPADLPELTGSLAWALLTPYGVARWHLDPALAARGVRWEPLGPALNTLPAGATDLLGSVQPDGEDRYTALNAALWQPGWFCYVPPGVRVEEPFLLLHWTGPEASGYFPRVLAVVDREAEAQVVETYRGAPEDLHRLLVSAVVEVVVNDGARVVWSAVQQLSPRAEAFLRRRGRVHRDGALAWHTGEFGAALSVAGHATELVGSGAAATSATVFFGTGSQHQDYAAQVFHRAPHTTSDILARGVMAERSRSIFTGQSVIVKGAVKSDARQREQTLMLSPEARADAIPSLVIDDNDVFAAHAASAGPVDPTVLYYLQSRGLSPRAAERMVVAGFLAPVLDKLAPEALRQTVESAIERKLDALGGDEV